jgi:hypothetical protein
MIPAHEGTGGISGDSGGDPDRCPGSGLLAEERELPSGGRLLHDDHPSRYLNDTSGVHDDDSPGHVDHGGGDQSADSPHHKHHYDGRTHFYVLYSDIYLDIYDGTFYEYDLFDLDNYRPDDDD